MVKIQRFSCWKLTSGQGRLWPELFLLQRIIPYVIILLCVLSTYISTVEILLKVALNTNQQAIYQQPDQPTRSKFNGIIVKN